jgi:hypothetical protein
MFSILSEKGLAYGSIVFLASITTLIVSSVTLILLSSFNACKPTSLWSLADFTE